MYRINKKNLFLPTLNDTVYFKIYISADKMFSKNKFTNNKYNSKFI